MYFFVLVFFFFMLCFLFFFQAEDGIRDAQDSRGLGDVYKRQEHERWVMLRDQIGDRLIDIRLVNVLCE